MKKTELIKKLSAHSFSNGTKISQDIARETIDAIFDIISEGLKTDKEVQITGFGTFKSNYKPAREGHNPKNTNEKIPIAARNQVSFCSGANLKKYINS
jgi:DNA-binding protein HU-beta